MKTTMIKKSCNATLSVLCLLLPATSFAALEIEKQKVSFEIDSVVQPSDPVHTAVETVTITNPSTTEPVSFTVSELRKGNYSGSVLSNTNFSVSGCEGEITKPDLSTAGGTCASTLSTLASLDVKIDTLNKVITDVGDGTPGILKADATSMETTRVVADTELCVKTLAPEASCQLTITYSQNVDEFQAMFLDIKEREMVASTDSGTVTYADLQRYTEVVLDDPETPEDEGSTVKDGTKTIDVYDSLPANGPLPIAGVTYPLFISNYNTTGIAKNEIARRASPVVEQVLFSDLADTTFTTPITGVLAPGTYNVRWTVLSYGAVKSKVVAYDCTGIVSPGCALAEDSLEGVDSGLVERTQIVEGVFPDYHYSGRQAQHFQFDAQVTVTASADPIALRFFHTTTEDEKDGVDKNISTLLGGGLDFLGQDTDGNGGTKGYYTTDGRRLQATVTTP
ncbi:hypothetical protein RI844_14570 [Thalassotalea fonticola]|uniref:Uncharacterized protein n=1 Tax=Thalassotalea fonticola TaxID=3065649 RepID=A0ABZ0GLI5_9GAMM|nr:hypothetical protein RI844_14570 [Colwelliaceae bacterium S1-1]